MCYLVVKHMTKSSLAVFWKMENAPDITNGMLVGIMWLSLPSVYATGFTFLYFGHSNEKYIAMQTHCSQWECERQDHNQSFLQSPV